MRDKVEHLQPSFSVWPMPKPKGLVMNCVECNQSSSGCTCPASIRTGGNKFDSDKPRVDLLPPGPLLEAATVLGFGAKKYGERNWELGISYGRLYAALLRHLWAWWRGDELDEESGLPHLAHALCCLLMMYDLHGNPPVDGLDDRQGVANG